MPRVLVIDDHDAMREGMAVTLKKQGHDVAAVRSGAEGIATYRKAPFDAVITDLKMEHMDGIEVVRQLKAHDPEAVVIVVTAFGTIEVAVQAMQLGAIDFLEKPFKPEVLRAKVDKALELSATRSQLRRVTAHNEALTTDARAEAG